MQKCSSSRSWYSTSCTRTGHCATRRPCPRFHHPHHAQRACALPRASHGPAGCPGYPPCVPSLRALTWALLDHSLVSRSTFHIQQISPQPQKSFSASTSTSLNALYASSPLSTPSKTLHYSTPPDYGSPNASFSYSPMNSPLAAYRGRHRMSAGREYFSSRFLFLVESERRWADLLSIQTR